MSRHTRRGTARSTPPTGRTSPGRASWPDSPVPTSTGTAWIDPDPDRPHGATLFVNGVPSSYVDLADPGFLAFEYMQNMAAVIELLPDGPLRTVHLGAAGCSLARSLHQSRPGSRQLGVDLDARLIELSRLWFDLPRSPELRLRAGEARAELGTMAPESADLIIRDVFAGDTTPAHLTTVEFARQVAQTLKSDGLYLANVADRPPLASVRREIAAVAASWGPDPWSRLALIAEPAIFKNRRYGNLVLAATRPGAPSLSDAALARRLRTLPVPARLITGNALATFVGDIAPSRDSALPPETGAPATSVPASDSPS